MTDKNIVYLFDVCGLSVEKIALQSGLTVAQVNAIISKEPAYPLAYTPRHHYR